jgi:hypothetical protein
MNIFWTKEEENQIKLGFTKAFLEKAAELWHVYPIKHKLSKGKPFLVIECTEEQFSIESPLTGKLTYMNEKAITFPCLLKEDDVVAIISNETLQESPIPTPTWVHVGEAVPGRGPVNLAEFVVHHNGAVLHDQAVQRELVRRQAQELLREIQNPVQGQF